MWGHLLILNVNLIECIYSTYVYIQRVAALSTNIKYRFIMSHAFHKMSESHASQAFVKLRPVYAWSILIIQLYQLAYFIACALTLLELGYNL